MRAILSVYDKRGIVDLARGLLELGCEIFSTGGTQRELEKAGVAVRSISVLTSFPEIMDGRVKTLHPSVHGGILARRENPSDMEELARHGIGLIDLVAVNLYPFVQAIRRADVGLDEALENIDIGGPTMLRAAAKNFPYVIPVVDPFDYPAVVEKLKGGEVSLDARRYLAQKAFQHTATYDTAVAQYLLEEGNLFPQHLTIALKKQFPLKYGENPHQEASFYVDEFEEESERKGVASLTLLAGPELSFNNIADLDAAINIASDYSAPTVTIIKHGNPCGLACASDLAEAYRHAFDGDPVSAFGGVIGLNREVDLATANEILSSHYDAVVAPSFQEEALEALKSKKGLRIISAVGTGDALLASSPAQLDFRRVAGGLLAQTPDRVAQDEVDLRVMTERGPTLDELTDLLFAWRAARHVKSNGIVVAKRQAILGIGAGQPNRAISVEIALKRAAEKAVGSVLASDAFFPFPDGVEIAARGGIKAIIQPGGSVRDEQVIKAANRHHVAMVFTGRRHFRH
ncbi:MAG: bifunctional phosphoribosylaminoimidazolecarboxamide formyltransferase/IMP cyclohydrolase [Dehalococcoidia bacterium]|nr:bifunctional phosphoribosylaminoimidazolecarboxamide formyltransferase/IMP cyclohydrolase [Dehalococcoidia bacterium]